MFTTYEDAIGWIHSRLRLGIKPGLQRMEWMMEKLNHPERRLKVIHIGGTNGKGSTLSYIHSILEAEGIMVGTFTSPYIEQFNERITLGGKPISDEDIVQLVNDIYPLAVELEGTDLGEPSEFEVITVMAIHYFAHIEPVDIALFEVGLGGRLDSTNVLHPLLSIITTIGLDHTAILGETIEAITTEKAGIIKAGTPIISGVKQQEAMEIIEKTAKQKHAKMYQANKQFEVNHIVSTEEGEAFSFQNTFKTRDRLEITMSGVHQVENASLALMAIDFLNQYFSFVISEESIATGLKQTFWPGRFERLTHEPLTILDGAHNQEGMDALCNELGKRYAGRDIYVIFAALKDKPLENMIHSMEKCAKSITFVDFDFPRAAKAEELSRLSSNDHHAISSDWQAAIRETKASIGTNDILVITGSLYFISEVKRYLANDK